MSVPGVPGVPGEPLIVAEDLVVDFPISRGVPFGRDARTLRAVDHVSLEIRAGETLALVGESGSGKSTTGRAILQMTPPTSGSVRYQGQELTTLSTRERRPLTRELQLVFQDPYSSLDPRMTVAQLVGEPLRVHGVGRSEIDSRVRELLGLVGLSEQHLGRRPHQFSGGQRQRIAIARALVARPAFVVCDEPVSALDVSVQAQVLNLLRDLQARFSLTYLFISHDLAVVRSIADRVAVMYLGRIVELAPARALQERVLHPYTTALLSAVPEPEPELERTRERIVLSGDPPSPIDPPAGCPFHTRCWLRTALGNPERCTSERPELLEVRDGWSSACHFPDEVEQRTPVGAAAPAA
jgi:oligopeptide transport system ATP-binding protein